MQSVGDVQYSMCVLEGNVSSNYSIHRLTEK